MICQCGNQNALRMRFYCNEKGTKGVCDICGDIQGLVTIPDIYFKGRYFDEHITDGKHRNGTWVESKRHKAKLLKDRNLMEAGDMKNPVLGRPAPFIKDADARRRFFRDNYGG